MSQTAHWYISRVVQYLSLILPTQESSAFRKSKNMSKNIKVRQSKNMMCMMCTVYSSHSNWNTVKLTKIRAPTRELFQILPLRSERHLGKGESDSLRMWHCTFILSPRDISESDYYKLPLDNSQVYCAVHPRGIISGLHNKQTGMNPGYKVKLAKSFPPRPILQVTFHVLCVECLRVRCKQDVCRAPFWSRNKQLTSV